MAKQRLAAEVTAERLDRFLDRHAVDLVRRYLGGAYSGQWFDLLEPRGNDQAVANQFTATDLVALTTLEVRPTASLTIDLLAASASRSDSCYEELLGAIPADIALHEANESLVGENSAWEALRRRIRSFRGIGPVATSKLLARKRPDLIPMRDRHVVTALTGKGHRLLVEPLRSALSAHPEFLDRLETVRSQARASHLSLLRVCDIVVWMRQHGLDDPSPRQLGDPQKIRFPSS